MKKLKIFILSTGTPSRRLIKAIESRGHTYERYNPKELYLLVSDSINGKDRLFAENGEDEPKELFPKDFDAVMTRLGGGGEYGLTVLQHLTDNIGLYSAQRAGSIRIASNKMWTTQKASAAGLNSPVTVFAKNPKNIPFLISQVGDLPCVLKTPYGSQGTGVIKMVDYQQTTATIELCNSKEIDTLLQMYIPAGGTDYRAIVVGDKVVCTMLRIAKDGFKANISQGGEGKNVVLSEAHQKFCVDASKAIGLKFSGIDIMISNQDSKAYLVEINSNPGTKSIDICSHNWFIDWVELIEKEVTAKTKETATANMSVGSLFVELYYKQPLPESHLSNNMPLREIQVLIELYNRGKPTDASVVTPIAPVVETQAKKPEYVKNPSTEKRSVNFV